MKGLRRNRDPKSLLRVLPMHPGCGHSPRETVVPAREARLADMALNFDINSVREPYAEDRLKAGPFRPCVFTIYETAEHTVEVRTLSGLRD